MRKVNVEKMVAFMQSLESMGKQDQLFAVAEFLKENCAVVERVGGTKRHKCQYFIGDETVYALVQKPTSEEFEFTLLDKDIYDSFIADGMGSLCMVRRDFGSIYKVAINSKNGRYSVCPLHRLVFLHDGCDIKECQVDHILNTKMINTREFLRACSGKENCQNRHSTLNQVADTGEDCLKNLDVTDFRYNPVTDFSDSWYAIVLYKMAGLPSDVACDYNRGYQKRLSQQTA